MLPKIDTLAGVDVLLVDMDAKTAYCSDGVTRPLYEMYNSDAEPTEDPDDAIVAIVKVADDQYIILNLNEEGNTTLN